MSSSNPAPARWWLSWGTIVFLAVLGIRAGYLWDVRTHPGHGHWNFYLVQGAPYGDARSWHTLGSSVAAGHGMAFWQGRRPFYALFLAMFYVWTGPWYGLALALNLLAAAHTAVLVFRSFARLFGVPVGLTTAAWLAVNPEALTCTCLTLSETVGLWFLAWHLWTLIEGLERQSPGRLAVSGLLFGLSNVTRTLTLPALAPYAVCLPLVWWLRGARPARAAGLTGALVGGTLAVVLPAMAINYAQNGIFTLSDNTALDFYAATHPDYGHWQSDLERGLVERGLVTVKEQYDFMLAEGRRNLWEHPGLFLGRYRDNLVRQGGELTALDPRWLVALTLCLAFTAWREPTRPGWRWLPFAVVGIVACVTTGIWGLAPGLLLGLAATFVPRLEPGRLAAWLLLGATVAAVSIFGAIISRVLLMEHWLAVGLGLGGVATVLSYVLDSSGAPASHAPTNSAAGWPRWLVAAGAVFVLASLGRIAYRSYVRTLPIPFANPVSARVVGNVLAPLIEREGEVFTRLERELAAGPSQWLIPVAGDDPTFDNGRLVVIPGRLSDEVYYFPRGVHTNSLWRLFYHRDYERTVGQFLAARALGRWSDLETVFPGDLRSVAGREFVLVGRANANPQSMYESLTIEALALIPWARATDQLDLAGVRYLGEVPEHRRVLRALVDPAALTAENRALPPGAPVVATPTIDEEHESEPDDPPGTPEARPCCP